MKSYLRRSAVTTSFLLLAALLFFFGCVAKPQFIRDPFNPPTKIAVLPMNNHSNDVNGPVLMRLLFVKMLSEKGFNVQGIEYTDQVLNGLGITDGGQLSAVALEDLASALKVNGLFFGELLKFEYTVGVIETKKQVKADFKLIQRTTEEQVWWDFRESKYSKNRVGSLVGGILTGDVGGLVKDVVVDAGTDLLVKGMESGLQKVLGHPLRQNADEVIGWFNRTLPKYTGEKFALPQNAVTN